MPTPGLRRLGTCTASSPAGPWVWLMPAWRILRPGINILSTAVYLPGDPHGKLRVQEQWGASWPPFCTPSRLTSNMAKEKQMQERWCRL